MIDNARFEQWKYARPVPSCHYRGGIYYNQLQNEIITLGGNNPNFSTTVHTFDLRKEKWTQLVSTNLNHKNRPLIWYDFNLNIYCVASVVFTKFEGIEMLDPRTNKWCIVANHSDMENIWKCQLINDDTSTVVKAMFVGM